MNAPVHYDPTGDVWSMPLDQIDVSDPKLYQNDASTPILSGCGGKTRCITARTGCTGHFGR